MHLLRLHQITLPNMASKTASNMKLIAIRFKIWLPKKNCPVAIQPRVHGNLKIYSDWWFTYASEKNEFVSWDDDIPN